MLSGREGVRACGFCHLADGSGRPENAPVSAYHPAYFIQQMDDFKNGLRKSADPRKANTNNMIGFAKMITPRRPGPPQSISPRSRTRGA